MIERGNEVYRLHKNGEARYLTFRRFEDFSELRHLFTTRWGGISQGVCENWNLGFGTGNDPDTPENRSYNLRVLAECMGTTPEHTVWTQQTHTTNILTVTEEDMGKGAVRPRGYTDVDGLVTDRREVALVSLHADCNPLFFYDPRMHVIGLAHSGWKGTLNGIGSALVERMVEEFGCHRQDILCGIGPSLCQDCFEVDEDVAQLFFDKDERNRALAYMKERGGVRKYYIDLWAMIRKDLALVGLAEEHIQCMELCTKENPQLFFSHRGQHGKRGLMAASMMLV